MKRLFVYVMIVLLSGALAMPAFAKQPANVGKDPRAAADTAAKADKKRDKAYQKALKIESKRETKRQDVDAKMQQRLDLINQDSPGNIGPIGN